MVQDVSGRELLPGFVHFPGVLPLTAQQSLIDMACSIGEGQEKGRSGGWYRFAGEGSPQLNDGTKARFWDTVDLFPPEFCALGESLARLAGERFPAPLQEACAKFKPRVGALNFYTGRGKMNWHCDDYNFAKKERPIVMASLGDAADFGYKMKSSDPDNIVRLESGDVIVFGGEARDLVHALLRVHAGTCPPGLCFPALPGPGRVSVTWRDAGPEDGLVFNSDQRLGLTLSEHTLPRYLPGRQGKGKGKGKGQSKGRKGG
eukprot:TRINITY_DN8609_c3_g1_i1.p1 TRINITY_DN8609_c3_g1~~TRINITY_DN8609_c3_g1_i1.p1  ORF type:complete len:304 (-),score=48.87 TRINITY_DN8609_c3_g1_i1:104-883(-)